MLFNQGETWDNSRGPLPCLGPVSNGDRNTKRGLKITGLIQSVILLQYQYLIVADNNVSFNREKRNAPQGKKILKDDEM